MTNWKEKGFVPDSDDEDELDSKGKNENFKSSSTKERDTTSDKSQPMQKKLTSVTTDVCPTVEPVTLKGPSGPFFGDCESRSSDEPPSLISQNGLSRPQLELGDHEAKELDISSQQGLLTHGLSSPAFNFQELPRSSEIEQIYKLSTLPSSPLYPKVFKTPKSFWDDIEDENCSIEASASSGNINVQDDISKSYVQISSPASSILSSPPTSLPDAFEYRKSELPARNEAMKNDTIERHTINPFLNGSLEHEIQNSSEYPMKRALRQRNLIQIHPYIVEQEKYRQILKSRGIAPLRIIESQENRGCQFSDSVSQNRHNEEEQSQEFDDSFVSQTSEIESNPETLKAPMLSFEMSSDSGDPISLSFGRKNDTENKENFPDIDTLTKERKFLNPRIRSTERRASSSTRIQSWLSDKATSQLNLECPAIDKLSDDLNSTSVIEMSRTTSNKAKKSPIPSVVSISSLGSPREPFNVEETVRKLSGQLSQTPESFEDVGINSNLNPDNDDPFASDLERHSQTGSFSDESIQLRRVGRKIRGVLPASHLRLDCQTDSERISRHSKNPILSPVRNISRKGIAIPKARTDNPGYSASSSTGLKFLADDDDEDEEDEEIAVGIIRGEENSNSDMEDVSDDNLKRFVEEDNSIDQMLPSRKRSSSSKSQYSVKKRKTSGAAPQTRITSHLKNSSKAYEPLRRIKGLHHMTWNNSLQKSHPRSLGPLCLSIIDVIDTTSAERNRVPDFIRIAIRTAKRQKNQGRHLPFGKSIRLATIEDTQNVMSVLAMWNSGLIVPNIALKSFKSSPEIMCSLPNQVHSNKLNKFCSFKKPRGTNNINPINPSVNRNISQRSLDEFVFTKPIKQSLGAPGLRSYPYLMKPRKPLLMKPTQRMRPAQLESSNDENNFPYQSSAFKSFKKKLDNLYTKSLTKSVTTSNIRLGLFLEGKDRYNSSILTGQKAKDRENIDTSAPNPIPAVNRQRKRIPKRIDAGAIKYRQPINPLELDSINSEKQKRSSCDSKLQGLACFGTKYQIHFDIFPLHEGTFFKDDSFIGSGRLKQALQGISFHKPYQSRNSISLSPGEKCFSWSTWDEISSSEIGICFDYLSDSLTNSRDLETSSNMSAKEIILFLLDFSQNRVSFDGILDQNNYLSRMIQVIQEFLYRLNSDADLSTIHREQRVYVFSICSVLIFHLLRTARTNHETSLISELEKLLKETSSHCAHVLLQGLESVRKLYDNLQYYSYRQTGIDSKQHAVDGWVIIIKILEAAHIQKGSFWDIVNDSLHVKEVSNCFDAVFMENLWYSLFSILPLCEFDELGRVASGRRQSASFDNWFLPQIILNRIFTLYISNPRQHFGFNEYCKSVLSRCHYLMTEWGWWKCAGLIGSIFDFFASQKLSNLRNEEVYHSPTFLSKLDAEPSLQIEPEDSCFHVFLKILAHEFKHLNQAHDMKAIRNLGARLLPNHDRKYPKEEEIHQRDLASLRNHHDLLCTLFFSMPTEYRPSVSLIQELVIAGRSHREACIINLKSWENLTRFLVTNTTDPKLYQPFKNWQSSFFSSLYKEFIGVEAEVRQQAEEIYKNSRSLMTDTCINETIMANKNNLIAIMCRAVNAMGRIIKIITHDSMMKQALNHDLLFKALDLQLYNQDQSADCLLLEVNQTLVYCMDQTEKLYPIPLNDVEIGNSSNGESQDSIDMTNWCRLEMISILDSLLNSFRPVIKKRIFSQLGTQKEDSVATQLIDCLGRLISLTTENDTEKFQSIFLNDSKFIFENRHSCTLSRNYWLLFVAKLMDYGKSLEDFKISGFDIGTEWLCSLTEFEESPIIEAALTYQLNRHGHFLCQTPNLFKLGRLQIIKSAICRMSNLLIENSTEMETGLTQKHAQRYFSEILGEVLKSMQKVLESLDPDSENHIKYLTFARSVITNIKCYASDFRTLTEFFIHPSVYYWPHDSDPNLYAAGIISYCLRLGQQPERTSIELFYYLHSGWTNALISNQLGEFTKYIERGMKRKEFTQFMMAEFIPVVLQVGFCINGWILCSAFLPTISYRVRRLLEMPEPYSTWMFDHFINILKVILNGTKGLIREFSDGLRGAHPKHRGILAVVFQFWMQNAALMNQYVERYPHVRETLRQITDPLSNFIYHSLKSFEIGHTCQYNLSGDFNIARGVMWDKFIAFFEKEINEFWQFPDDSNFRVIVRSRSRELSAEQSFTYTLEEVLRGELAEYEALFHCPDGVVLMREPNLLIEQIII